MDKLRIIPRIVLLLYGICFYYVVMWFTEISNPNTAQSVFTSAFIGSAALFFNFYLSSSGKNQIENLPPQGMGRYGGRYGMRTSRMGRTSSQMNTSEKPSYLQSKPPRP